MVSYWLYLISLLRKFNHYYLVTCLVSAWKQL